MEFEGSKPLIKEAHNHSLALLLPPYPARQPGLPTTSFLPPIAGSFAVCVRRDMHATGNSKHGKGRPELLEPWERLAEDLVPFFPFDPYMSLCVQCMYYVCKRERKEDVRTHTCDGRRERRGGGCRLVCSIREDLDWGRDLNLPLCF